MKISWILNPTTAAIVVPEKEYRIDFSVTNESARISPSRRLQPGEEITVYIRTGGDWTPITTITSITNPGGILLMAYGYYGVTKNVTTEPLGVYVDKP